MEEKKYQIYYTFGAWLEPSGSNNSISHTIMYKENPSEEKLKEDLDFFKKDIESRYSVVEWKVLSQEFLEEETWYNGWFFHSTHNKFENQNEAFRSFENYVDRKKHKVDDAHCLMGAEDRWRWKICECNGCKKRNVTTINH